MKTSNKLFGFVILLVLALPLLVLSFLRKSIREGDYIIRDIGQPVSRGTYKPYKTLKIVAPAPDILRCYFFPGDSTDMRYAKDGYHVTGVRDSVRVYNSRDTLYVQYVAVSPDTEYPEDRKISSERKYSLRRVNLHLSSFDDIVVDGGTIVIDSLWQPAKINLGNGGLLELAQNGQRTVRRESKQTSTGEYALVGIDSVYSGDFRELDISADNGRLAIGSLAWVLDLKLDLRGGSHLIIDTTARIDQIAGTISPESTLTALPEILRKLTPLVTKDEKVQ